MSIGSYLRLPLRFLLVLYSLLLLVYAVFSYSLTDPNLVLLQWQPYWEFQNWMWQTFFHNRPLLTAVFVTLVTILFGLYLLIVEKLKRSSLEYERSNKQYFLIFGLLILPLLFSYNALSHDVFNYLFNAKMVLTYDANPHQAVALDFAQDEWVRFMHNTHTPAPYGYGWTALSLIPYLLGFGKFFLTWLSFRFWNVLACVLLYVVLQYAARVLLDRRLTASELALLFLNPLFVLEIISNMHNDLWMMTPAIAAVALLVGISPKKLPEWQKLVAAAGLLALSISIKLATAVLIPLCLLILLEKKYLLHFSQVLGRGIPLLRAVPERVLLSLESKLYQFIPVVAALLLFLPLTTERSQQFLPWYLTWVLVWLPLSKQSFLRKIVLLFSFTALIRYVPWLLEGGYSVQILFWQKVITWAAPVALLLSFLIPLSLYRKRSGRAISWWN